MTEISITILPDVDMDLESMFYDEMESMFYYEMGEGHSDITVVS